MVTVTINSSVGFLLIHNVVISITRLTLEMGSDYSIRQKCGTNFPSTCLDKQTTQ